MKFNAFSAVVALLVGASLVHADAGGIRDNGAFFSAQAKSEALRNIGEIEQRYRKDLVIETFSSIPQDLQPGVDVQDKAAMSRLYEEWAMKQARQQRVNGIYILLVKEPSHLQVLVGNDTQRNAFTLRDRDALLPLMLTKLRSKQNDDALLEGVSFVDATLRSHLPTRGRTLASGRRGEDAGSSHWIFTALIVGVVVWLVLRIFRAMAGGGGSAYAGAPGAGGGMMSPAAGGGGFMSNMLGGMFGAAAGMWIYDQFSGRSSSWGGGDAGNYDNGGFSGQDSDYSGSGGDFGSGDSGGSNFSGGDSGGSDFGGGDF